MVLLSWGPAIDLGAWGVTKNGTNGSAGPNDYYPFPEISWSFHVPGDNVVRVSFKAEVGSWVEFYRADPDPSGYGEGVEWLKTVKMGPTQKHLLTTVPDTNLKAGQYVTPLAHSGTTAKTKVGWISLRSRNTSEFGNTVKAL